jgi:hypothetical protein
MTKAKKTKTPPKSRDIMFRKGLGFNPSNTFGYNATLFVVSTVTSYSELCSVAATFYLACKLSQLHIIASLVPRIL